MTERPSKFKRFRPVRPTKEPETAPLPATATPQVPIPEAPSNESHSQLGSDMQVAKTDEGYTATFQFADRHLGGAWCHIAVVEGEVTARVYPISAQQHELVTQRRAVLIRLLERRGLPVRSVEIAAVGAPPPGLQ